MISPLRASAGAVAYGASLAAVIWIWQPSLQGYLLTGELAGVLIALGLLAGLLAVVSILWQIMLIGRVAWLEQYFGFDRLSRLHHYNGLLAAVFIAVHPVLLIIGHSGLTGASFPEQLLLFIRAYDYVLLASVAWVLILSIVVVSLTIIRKKLRYEYWYAIHLGTYAAIALAFAHQTDGTDFIGRPEAVALWYSLYAIAFGSLLYYRIGRPLYNFVTQQFTVSRIVRENDDVTSVYIKGSDIARLKPQAGQFIIVRFLARGFWWEAHPFSLSNVPTNNELRISAKAVGDFTRRLPQLPINTRVLVEGPYGVFTHRASRTRNSILIAGGIGITPIRALAEELSQKEHTVTVLYAAQSENQLVLREELEQLKKQGVVTKYFVDRYINQDDLAAVITKSQHVDAYVCGPVLMMKTIIAMLKKIGLPRRAIHFEKFALG